MTKINIRNRLPRSFIFIANFMLQIQGKSLQSVEILFVHNYIYQLYINCAIIQCVKALQHSIRKTYIRYQKYIRYKLVFRDFKTIGAAFFSNVKAKQRPTLQMQRTEVFPILCNILSTLLHKLASAVCPALSCPLH